MRSIRSFSRGRTESERGFVLISAIVLAVLYFMLMELMLIDSSRALREAQRFRSKIVAATLAENAAELAAQQMVSRTTAIVTSNDAQGTMKGTYNRTPAEFVLTGTGTTSGVMPVSANVRVQGRVEGTDVKIDYATHSQ